MRTEEQIQDEIAKVEQARRTVLKKVDRCLARQMKLYKELHEVHYANNNN